VTVDNIKTNLPNELQPIPDSAMNIEDKIAIDTLNVLCIFSAIHRLIVAYVENISKNSQQDKMMLIVILSIFMTVSVAMSSIVVALM
jgi:hypothetical protein